MITLKELEMRKLYIIHVYCVTKIAEDIIHKGTYLLTYFLLFNKHHLTKTTTVHNNNFWNGEDAF